MRLARDERARVPFAIVGALIIMLSVFSTAYLQGTQSQAAGHRMAQAEVQRQKRMLSQAEEVMASEAHFLGSKAVAAATQFLCDESLLERTFQENYTAYISDRFPYFRDPYMVEVRDFRASIFFEQSRVNDLVLSNDTVRNNVTLRGQNGTEETSQIEVRDTASAMELGETSVLARYIIAGQGNCTVRNTRSGSVMEAALTFQRKIDSPFPLMNSKMGTLEAEVDNNAMGLARIIKYALTTMAQFRVLEGYGSGLEAAEGNITGIITEADIRAAVDLAIVLETARLFRDYDANAMGSSELRSLVDDYVQNGTVDPGDIIAIFNGLDDKRLPVDMMLAQAINAITDQFVLKFLDYLGITDLTNQVYSTCQEISQMVEDLGRSLSDFIFGSDGENRDGVMQVTDWIDDISREMTWPPEGIDDTNALVGTGDATQLAVLDILQPVNESFSYSAVCRGMASSSEQPIYDADGELIGTEHIIELDLYNSSAQTVTSDSLGLEGYLADFAPVDLLRPENDALWSDFYQNYYADREDVIYYTVRDAVKNMTLEMSGIISKFIDQSDLTLNGYDGGKYSVDPTDRLSVLESINRLVDDVLDDTLDHLKNNSAAMETLLSSLTDKTTQLILDYIEFVSLHYDALADRTLCMDTGLVPMAYSMLWNSSTSSSHDITVWENYSEYNDLGLSRGYVNDPATTYHCTGMPDRDAISYAVVEQNLADLSHDLDPYLNESFNTLKSLETGWHSFGHEENGYYIKALEEVARGRNDDLLMKFIGPADSLVSMAGEMAAGVLGEMAWSSEMANVQYSPRIVHSEGDRIAFQFREGQNDVRNETFRVEHELASLDIVKSQPIGLHYTDAATFSQRPFETAWQINVSGVLRVKAASDSTPYLINGTYSPTVAERDMMLDLGIPITVYSGWALEGVEYQDTASLADDLGKLLDTIRDFLGWVWGTIAGPINWVIDQIMTLVEFFQDVVGKLLGYASEIMSIVTDLMGFLVEMAQDFLRDIADWAFGGIVGWILKQMPEDIFFTFSMFGYDFNVSFAPKNSLEAAANGSGASLMKVRTEGQLLGAGFDVEIDLRMLPDEVAQEAGIDYDLLISSQVVMKGFTLNTSVDPFMVVQEHLVECEGSGAGWGMDLVIPEVENYDSVQYSLHDIPGVGAALSNIPIPPLGVKASVNAGLEILYTLRGLEAEHVVINEVELNPRGGGSQWVELYNPGDYEANIGRWKISETTRDVNHTFSVGRTIEAGGYLVVELEAMPESDAILSLLDSSEQVIDRTEKISDASALGTASTWQRAPNGANLSLNGKWEFNGSSEGSENACPDPDFREVAWNLIKGAFNTTWQELKDELALSLDFIVELVTRFIQRFIEDVLRVIERTVVETSLFLDVMLTDMSGSGGAGITLSFVIEGGDTLAQILRWIIDSVAAFVNNFGQPSQPGQYPKLSEEVPEHLFIRLDFYALVGVPRMVKNAVKGAEDIEEVKLAGRIEANIPALAQLTGRDMGRWRINFGTYVEEMPAAIADPLFGTGDATPDVWLFRGTVYEE